MGVYQKQQTPLEAMMMGTSQTEAGFIPYTILTGKGSAFQDLNFFVWDGVNIQDFLPEITRYVAKMKNRPASEIMTQTVVEQMGSVDTVLGGMSADSYTHLDVYKRQAGHFSAGYGNTGCSCDSPYSPYTGCRGGNCRDCRRFQ